ncbi:MAG: PHP domain-containing protein [Ruminococcaceae bacterium]|nr:PHP domain-containing protein [Oscillospiraceae bacterium]
MKYVIDHDLHIHSHLSSCSGDPNQTPAAILDYARQNGFKHICLTDHFWDETVPGASDWYKPQNYAHIKKSLPLPMADGVTFHFGCETEMDRFSTVGISRKVLDELDFVIVPTSHLHMTGFTIEADDTSVTHRAKYYMERNHSLLDMDLPFKKMGLAHFTSCLDTNCEGSRDDILNAITDVEYAEFFERLAQCGMGLELNTPLADVSSQSALRPYRIARSCGCKFYLGSDAHGPDGLNKAHARFQAIVDALGLTEDDKFSFV